VRLLVEQNRGGILTYGITPPKRSYPDEKLREVADAQKARIGELPVDGLVVYDLQDESARTDAPRPFPYLACVDSVTYGLESLAELAIPKVVYRCITGRSRDALVSDLRKLDQTSNLGVLVGAASRNQAASLKLSEAYALAKAETPRLPIGGVLIAERHEKTLAEDARALAKMDAGCTYFVSQAVYSVHATKNLLSDLHYRCEAASRPVPPVLVTLSPCGSLRTLDFMRWLGVAVPRWLENDLRHAKDILGMSLEVCRDILADLHDFARARQIPLGCNIESVSLAKVEIEASVELVHFAADLFARKNT
jgi:hypothetical protein